ncbi:MAG TPA: membrane protein insertion efficiency factor YidD [Stenomitos sp.]
MNSLQVILLGLIHAYRRLVSPLLPPSCRYQPTCSAYALDAIRQHGAIAGSWLALKRILRCHPWSAGGYDPVPTCSHKSTPDA